MKRRFLVAIACVAVLALPACAGAGGGSNAAPGVVLVAGATGRTGRLIVDELVRQGYAVRAFVRDAESARGELGEGVGYAEGDVRERASIDAALAGVTHVLVAIGATRGDPANAPEFVDYGGVKNIAEASAAAGVRHVVLMSSSGVTDEDHFLNRAFNNVLTWKLRGENALRESGVAYTVVRPGGLLDKPGGQAALRFEQGDTGTGVVARADAARVMVAAIASPAARNKTFELFSGEGMPPADWNAAFAALAAD